MSVPHHIASFGAYPFRGPKVSSAVVAPCEFTLRPVGLTRTCAAAGLTPAASRAHTRARGGNRRTGSEDGERDAGAQGPVPPVVRRVQDHVESVGRLPGPAAEGLDPRPIDAAWPKCEGIGVLQVHVEHVARSCRG